MDDILEMELQLELKALRNELDKKNEEIDKYKKVIKDNDLGDEIEGFQHISPEEQICVNGIKFLAERFQNGTFDRNDVSNYDILHKNIRMIRGHNTDVKKGKVKFDPKEAMKIINGFKKDD